MFRNNALLRWQSLLSLPVNEESMPTESSIPCSTRTRDLVKAAKRGGQTYDELLRLMIEQYEPEAGAK
jgi:hypothetical protein